MVKFHWGHGITLFYILFVSIVVTALVASFSVDHSLVVDDYYAQDLAYQSTYDKIENNNKHNNVEVKVDDNAVSIDFKSDETITGNVHFYRASDKTADFNRAITSNTEVISITNVKKGKWKLKIDWQEGSKSYYKEAIIYL